jgi:hypothetical protein
VIADRRDFDYAGEAASIAIASLNAIRPSSLRSGA